MIKSTNNPKMEHDFSINESIKHPFIEKKVLQAQKTLKKVGLPRELKLQSH